MAVRRSVEQVDTRSAILDIAERLVQSRGFNGFSYADVAAELGITKAALHYHFPGKAELGEALIARYALRFGEALAAIDAEGGSALARLQAYADLYLGVLRDERMCLCGMLAAEYQTLSDPMRQTVVRFFDDNHAWLVRVLQAGRTEGTLVFSGTPEEAAPMIVGTLEGAMLVARPYGDAARFETVAARLIAEFTNAHKGSRQRQ
ncbi:MAG: TetR/AcrR family transcriptional regulator [Acidimicrobiales bacterium]|jgi:TetR/AcrR family transcriptional repressor of nem operon